MPRSAGANALLAGRRRSPHLGTLVILGTVLGISLLVACGTDGEEQDPGSTPIADLTREDAPELALSYAREQGLFHKETPESITVLSLTAGQARQQQVDLGFADPFGALSPAPDEDAPVWVVTLIEELILPAPGEGGTVQARSVVAIVDAESGQVLSAVRREPEDQ